MNPYPSPASARIAPWLRLRPGEPRPPWTIVAAIRLMYVAAVAQLAAMITLAVTSDAAQAALLRAGYTAAQAHAFAVLAVIGEVGGGLITVLWPVLAWVAAQVGDGARLALIGLLALQSLHLVIALAQHAATFAPAAMLAAAVEWCLTLAVVVLIFGKGASAFYLQAPAS